MSSEALEAGEQRDAARAFLLTLALPCPSRPNDVIIQVDGMDAAMSAQRQIVQYVSPFLNAVVHFGVVQVRCGQ